MRLPGISSHRAPAIMLSRLDLILRGGPFEGAQDYSGEDGFGRVAAVVGRLWEGQERAGPARRPQQDEGRKGERRGEVGGEWIEDMLAVPKVVHVLMSQRELLPPSRLFFSF